MKLLSQLFVLALAPSLAFGSLFSASSHVQMLDSKSFKKAMKTNQTSLVVYVTTSSGHCRHMAAEMDQASEKLHPLIPTYAVDCDNEKNKALCAEEWVQKLPTVTLFPRGNTLTPTICPERKAAGVVKWTSSHIPDYVTQLSNIDDIESWKEKASSIFAFNAATLMKVPLLWRVLANKYSGRLELAAHWDEHGQAANDLGLDSNTKVLIYPAGDSRPVKYEGTTKYEPLTKFFDSILDGTADIGTASEGQKLSDRPDDEL
ncbi:hypothetical protein AGABI1DRAFT_125961 [Agaricus bisporus var. burnettii JB137-S8]|uniref:Thioredoxin domain-containing protein n=1 Tax=Agaricus bisporus var. burnettii (strain JB137-S8 / ATCC MYA-4627 / FGSC 10392) TaxID=597362 RepID=K5X1D2_AGABU|nr:uncharacterized protein AGABI1DRAFT_125961 [Agaricus bisporus var. burnettii JB137-S8]EKM81591.1 hypothetical protein AGABI1DRAFT_125961 [Agaricus bisporus var. burnettii JB137-S8]